MGAQSHVLSSAGLGLLLLVSAGSRAAEHESKVAAEALFEQGRSLMAAERFKEACAKFEASQALDAGIGTLLYLADCYERGGRIASAWATFREAESLARVHEQKKRMEIARARALALEPKMSKVVIRVPPDSRVEGLTVTLGNTVVPTASWGLPLPIDPGEQRVAAAAPGRKPWQATVIVPRGDSLRYAVMVPHLEFPSKPVTRESERSNPGDTMRMAGIITGAVGVASLGVGAVFATLASGKKDESREECPAQANRCTEEGVELREQAGNYSDTATASFAAGGGLLLTGFVLYLTAPADQRTEGPSVTLIPKTDGKTAVNVIPILNGSSLGVKLHALF